MVMEVDTRPWGRYEVLSDDDSHKVKRITVEPGHRLSYQRHAKRAEHWFVVAGDALRDARRGGARRRDG